jgi:uncharacterized membrane protein YkvA (DUF1232 family)
MLAELKARARALRREVAALSIAARDPRTPWYVKGLILFVVAHTLSPIDLIPDFIPILGYLDDLIVTPLGIWLAVRWMPAEVMAEAREAAAAAGVEGSLRTIGAALTITVWLLVAAAVLYLIFTKLYPLRSQIAPL